MISIQVLTVSALELAAWAGLYSKVEAAKRRELLLHGKKQPTQLPWIDKELKKQAGFPSRLDRFVADKATKAVRFAVHTRAFEHLMVGLVNTKSSWHRRKAPKLSTTVRIVP